MATIKKILESIGKTVKFDGSYWILVGYDIDNGEFPCILRKSTSPRGKYRALARTRAVQIDDDDEQIRVCVAPITQQCEHIVKTCGADGICDYKQ